MDDFIAGGYRPSDHAPAVDRRSVDTDQEDLGYVDNPNQIVTLAPKEAFRLTLFDVTCIVLNRTIGSGIFNSPQRVIKGTQSTGASLLLWLLGSVYCLSGAHVYIEYGLNVPRFSIDGSEQPVARSGADLNYLQFVYPWPRKDSVFLSTTLFGIAFITLGNMAGNCIAFAVHIFHAADVPDPSSGAVRGVALAVALATCFLHTFSRRGGILLNNVFAIVKVLILLFIIITAILVAARALPATDNVFADNTDPATSFDSATEGGGSASDANGFAQAFLAIIFSFSGFEQPNYVLGEVRKPRRYPVGMITGVALVILLYMGVNLSYVSRYRDHTL
jgi:amino acid transporter